MSSSRRSSRSSVSHGPGHCPTCGSARVRAVRESVELRVGRARHRFEEVVHERCANCGERIFGIGESLRFDAVILAHRRTRAA